MSTPLPALLQACAALGAAWPLVAIVPALASETAIPQTTTAATAATDRVAAEPAATEVAAPLALTVGKSTVLRLPAPVERLSIGNPAVVDVTMTSPRELYLLGKGFGSSNVMLWRAGGAVTVIDVTVAVDTATLQRQLGALLPAETGIRVHTAGESIVLTGTVSSATKAEHAVALADGYVRAFARGVGPVAPGLGAPGPGAGAAGGALPLEAPGRAGSAGATGHAPRVINLLGVVQPQQVMLEVKVAEVSRTLLDQFGVGLNLSNVAGSVTWGLVTSRLQDIFGSLSVTKNGNGSRATVDGKFDDGIVKILAEPSIVSVSGQEGSFLAGGKIFIPVARTNDAGGTTVTLEEKEYGVGLKFTPVVLDGDLIHLRVAPEVSELARTGSPFVTTGGATTVLPSFTTRRAQTSVQLRDGQSLAIAGLIKNNASQNLSRFPFLGELPILGALFRSSEFQSDRSELIFVITPRLVRTLPAGTPLPTDGFNPASREERIFGGRLEGAAAPAPVPAPVRTTP
jgi:pilus assembly protein CpaC